MRIGIVKPDHGIVGGFELVLDRIIEGLEADSHTVRRISVDVRDLRSPVFGVDVSDSDWSAAPEFFRYLSVVERCRRADTSGVDLVVSTQPGSWAARHPNHMALMYHHHRVFYDLADVYVGAGFAPADIHARCVDEVRRIDSELFSHLSGFLACSEEFQRRLRRFNQIESLGVFHAGIGFRAETERRAEPTPPGESILCVSRHEFPKRTEVFAQAAAIHGRSSVIVGTGGRMAWTAELARGWIGSSADAESASPEETWLRQVPPEFQVVAEPSRVGHIEFAGRVTTEALDAAYRDALCVVAPAFKEDYGLTAIEAMSHGRPVIVCDDGGGLVDFIEHEVSGLVVEPSALAIAEAVERLAIDPELAAGMGRAALERSRQYTWERGWTELRQAISKVAER